MEEKIVEKQMDLRIQRTYKLLTGALIDLLHHQNFDSISVKEICDQAMVRRATFYKHFADKQELLAFTIRSLEDTFKEQGRTNETYNDPHDFYIAMIDQMLMFVEQEWNLLKNIFQTKGIDQLTGILLEEMEKDIRMELMNDKKKGNVLPVPPEIISTMIAGSMVYVMKRWVLGEIEVTREMLIKSCMKIRFID